MKKSRLCQIIAAAAPLVFFSVCAAADDGHHSPRWGDFAWRVANLVIFCGILWYFTGGLIKRFFKNRKQAIEDALSDLEKRREDAKAKLAEVEKRIANLEEERRMIMEESRAQAERLKKEIMENARKQASQIVDNAKRAAENEGQSMLADIRAKMADEIVDAATKALQNRLTQAEHDKLIDNALDKVALQ